MPQAKQLATSHPQSAEAKAWATREFNADFLVDSGLLFLLNHEIFHPLGLALSVREHGGKRSVSFSDYRETPGRIVFDPETAATASAKHKKFMLEWGLLQLQRRRLELGREVQDINPKD